MQAMPICRLPNRALILVGGPDARDYLQRMITQDVAEATPGRAGYGALLSPQGKILCDFLFSPLEDGFVLDAPAEGAGDLVKRLLMFRLRAQVEVSDVSHRLAVHATWNGTGSSGLANEVEDPRLPLAGHRLYAPEGTLALTASAPDYLAHRLALGLPELGSEAAVGEAFPHDIAMDCLNGISFAKGCFVGQEVVSRMKHRGTARRRPVVLVAKEPLPERGAEVAVGGRSLGAVGAVSGLRGLAVLRLDKVAAAMAAGEVVTVGGVAVTVELPSWADYGWPDASPSDE